MRVALIFCLCILCIVPTAQALDFERVQGVISSEELDYEVEWRIYDVAEEAASLRAQGDAASIYRTMRSLNFKLYNNELSPEEFLNAYLETAKPVNWPAAAVRDIDWAHRHKRYVDSYFENGTNEFVYGEFRAENAVAFIGRFSSSKNTGMVWFYPDKGGTMRLDYSGSPEVEIIEDIVVANGIFPEKLEKKGVLKITSRTRGGYDLLQETEQPTGPEVGAEPLETIEQATFSSEPKSSIEHVDVSQSELDAAESTNSLQKWLIALGAALFLGILAIWLLRRRSS